MSSENDDESNKEQYSVKKRVSIVWNYFEKLNRFRVRCKLCMHEQNYQGTTGNILRHLKNKHNIDATIKGRSVNPMLDTTVDVDKIRDSDAKKERDDDKEYDAIVKREQHEFNIITMPGVQNKSRSNLSSQDDVVELNPYAEETAVEFSDYLEPYLVETSTRLPKLLCSNIQADDNGSKLKEQTVSVLEERIIAEIEYFREKADYYRMQKNLTSLQAKKVRYELDQMG